MKTKPVWLDETNNVGISFSLKFLGKMEILKSSFRIKQLLVVANKIIDGIKKNMEN